MITQRFSGNPVFVTGGVSGIGAATARCFTLEGTALNAPRRGHRSLYRAQQDI